MRRLKQNKFKRPTQTLREIQAIIIEGLSNPHGNLETLSNLINSDGHSIDYRLEQYRTSFLNKRSAAMNFAYEVTLKFMPQTLRKQLCESYFSNYPSRSYELTESCSGFPQFLLHHSLVKSWPFLPTLAQFEWALINFAQQSRGFKGNNIRVAKFNWPVIDIWSNSRRSRRPLKYTSKKSVEHVIFQMLPEGVLVNKLTPNEALLMKRKIRRNRSRSALSGK